MSLIICIFTLLRTIKHATALDIKLIDIITRNKDLVWKKLAPDQREITETEEYWRRNRTSSSTKAEFIKSQHFIGKVNLDKEVSATLVHNIEIHLYFAFSILLNNNKNPLGSSKTPSLASGKLNSFFLSPLWLV